MGDMLSVLVPAYNEEEMVKKTCRKLKQLLEDRGIVYEILLIDDGSKDATWAEIRKESKSNPYVRGIRLSRNWGKEAAIFVGLEYMAGDCCVVMDCDLQHPPETILEMYKLWKRGYEVIEGVKEYRGDESTLHRICAVIFYKIISIITGMDMSKASDFKLLDRKVVQVLVAMQEKRTFFRALSSWCGFKTAKIPFEVRVREAGTSKWSKMSLVKYALTDITSFTATPMQIVTFFGMMMFLLSAILGVVTLSKKINGVAVEGFTTVIILQLFSSSIVMFSLGVMGHYIARIYEEVKGRPRSIIVEECGEKRNEDTISR